MQNFKTTIPQALIHGLLILSIAGCLKPRQKDEVQEAVLRHHQTQMNASFYVGRAITGTGYDNDSITGWSIPESKYYDLRACLSDRITNDRVIGHQFEVRGENQSGQLATTDDEGCLTWKELIPFNYFSMDAKYLTLVRNIVGTGIHSGSYTVSLAINPWRSSRGSNTPEVIDLSKGTVPTEQLLDQARSEQFLQAQFSSRVPVEIKDLNVSIQPRQVMNDGNQLDVNLSFSPQVVLNNIFGERIIHKIRQGEFDLFFQITASTVREDKSELYIVSDMMSASMVDKNNDDSTIIRFQDEKIDVQFTTTLRRRITNGHYDLAVRLVPRGMQSLDAFYGVYRFAEHYNILASRSGMRPLFSNLDQSEELYAFDQELEEAKRDPDLSFGRDLEVLEPFRFEHADIRFLTVLPGETTTRRSLAYSVEVCVKRTLDGRDAFFEDFIITKSNNETVSSSTSDDGCINWVDTITHQYYKPEQIFRKEMTITHEASGFSRQLAVNINPWDYGWTFGQDERKDKTGEEQRYIDRDPIISQLYIPDYGYETIRFRYEIDKFLNLNVIKTLLLDVSPRVLRYSSITRGLNATEYLRDGVYLMKVAVQKDYYDPRTPGLSLKSHPTIPGNIMVESSHNREMEYLDTFQKLVRVRHGKIITPIELAVNDLRLMRVRSNFLIEISPIDETRLGITPNMRLNDLDIAAIARSAQERPLAERTHPRQSEMGAHNLRGNYVEVQQIFSDEPFEVRNNEITELLRSEQPVQRHQQSGIDLNQFIDHDSGLPPRTFVGPIIMLSNSWGAGLRPTDELEEISECDNMTDEERESCENLNQQKDALHTFDNDPLVARFYGSSKHLENVSVTDLIDRAYINRLEYENQQTYDSLISRYVKEFYLDYVSLTHTPLKVLPEVDKAMETINIVDEVTSFTDLARHICQSDKIADCLENDDINNAPTPKERLLTELNIQNNPYYSRHRTYRRYSEFTAQDLQNIVKTGEYDETFGNRLCHVWVNYMMTDRVGYNLESEQEAYRRANTGWSYLGNAAMPPRDMADMAFNECTNQIRRHGFDNVFNLARILRPSRVEGYRFKGGKSLNFNVGASFSLGFGESMSTSLGTSFDPLSALESIPLIGKFIGGVLGVFSVKQSSSASQGRNMSLGTSISSGTYLATQRAAMDLYFDKFEPCIEIRMNTSFITNRSMSFFLSTLPSNQQKVDAISRGLFICAGEEIRENVPFRENYYYFTQHFTEGDMLDNGDLLNHPWLLALRGERNYTHFIDLIQATPQTDRQSRDFDLRWLPNNLITPYLNHSEEVMNVPDALQLGERPLDQLIEAYHMMPPTFPGLYMMMPNRLDYPN
jgi:hypothetical protein